MCLLHLPLHDLVPYECVSYEYSFLVVGRYQPLKTERLHWLATVQHLSRTHSTIILQLDVPLEGSRSGTSRFFLSHFYFHHCVVENEISTTNYCIVILPWTRMEQWADGASCELLVRSVLGPLGSMSGLIFLLFRFGATNSLQHTILSSKWAFAVYTVTREFTWNASRVPKMYRLLPMLIRWTVITQFSTSAR